MFIDPPNDIRAEYILEQLKSATTPNCYGQVCWVFGMHGQTARK
jgi:hypothetical protein